MEQTNKLELIKRTLQVVKSYNGEYDATILANCSLGLLFIAKEKYGEALSKARSEDILKKWGINVADIQICRKYDKKQNAYKEEERNVSNISRHIRNSFAHCNFEWINQDRNIAGIHFKDYPSSKHTPQTCTFDMEMTIANLRLFLESVANHILTTKRKPRI